MPLQKGKSQKVISRNIKELMRSYEEDKTIGNIKPKSKAHAVKIASAIAYRKARESGKVPLPEKREVKGTRKITSSFGVTPAKKVLKEEVRRKNNG